MPKISLAIEKDPFVNLRRSYADRGINRASSMQAQTEVPPFVRNLPDAS